MFNQEAICRAAELRKLIAVDLIVVDDFGLDAMDITESRDAYEVLTSAIALARSS